MSTQPTSKHTADERRALDTLAQLGGSRITDDAIERGDRFTLPHTMTTGEAIKYLKDYQSSQEAETRFSRTFKYRPWDVAAAFTRAMRAAFGTSGIGRAQVSFFGSTPPELRTIPTGVTDTIQVPWGQVAAPMIDATIYLAAQHDVDLGVLGHIVIDAPKRHAAIVEGLFVLIADELDRASIYRGKAINGADMPEFLNTATIDPAQVVYTDHTRDQLEANVWAVIRHSDAMQAAGLPLKRAVLLEGPYGTGKSLCGMLTAQVATDNGWGFIHVRPGKDDPMAALQTARLYGRTVVFVEDVDTLPGADDADRGAASVLLDALDGLDAKTGDTLLVMTTNHADKIHRGMLRPGRMDAVVHIGALDGPSVAQMATAILPDALVPSELRADHPEHDAAIGALDDATQGMMPAYVREAIDRALRYAIARTNGNPERLTVADLCAAANGLRPQLALMEDAHEGRKPEPLAVAMRRVVADVLTGAEIDPDRRLYRNEDGVIGLGINHDAAADL